MSVKSYTDVIITGKYFSIVDHDQKSKSALSTLTSIEEVMRKGLQYREDIEDEFSQLPEHELYAALRQRAEGIRDRYIEKTNTLSSFNRFFGGVSKKEKATFDRIVLLAEPPPVLELPNELIQHIFGFLQMSNLGKVAQINKHGENHVKQTEIQRAREYGYKGRDFAEAKDYLHNLFQSISTLVKDGHIPEEYVVRKGRWPFWRFVDSEATLINIKGLTANKAKVLKAHFSEVLLATVWKGQLEQIKTLLFLGADPNIPAANGSPPLHFAAQQGHAEVVTLLLEYGARVNDPGSSGKSALYFAIRTNVIKKSEAEIKETVRLLLEAGADPNIPAANGSPPLHFAAQQGHAEVVTLLLEYGARVNDHGSGGESALYFAIRTNVIKKSEAEIKETVRLLLEAGADPNIPAANGSPPLHFAAQQGHAEVVTLLLEYGARVNDPGSGGKSALYFAIRTNVIKKSEAEIKETVRLLLEAGADPNIPAANGSPPLHFAAQQGHAEVVTLLLEYGALIDAFGNNGNTALAFATESNRMETVKLLLERGANRTLLNHKGKTPYKLASWYQFRLRSLLQ